MKAIITKYLPATNTRGSRIKASAEGVPSIVIPYPYELSGEEVHKRAALTLCAKYGWNHSLVGGGLPDQSGYAFCFA
jgi:hypothetical protein